jgi:hypothetical protein
MLLLPAFCADLLAGLAGILLGLALKVKNTRTVLGDLAIASSAISMVIETDMWLQLSKEVVEEAERGRHLLRTSPIKDSS